MRLANDVLMEAGEWKMGGRGIGAWCYGTALAGYKGLLGLCWRFLFSGI